MDDELENFIRERKARVAADKASLEKDPPYMEMRAKPSRAYGSTVKENIPPRITIQGKDESCSVGLPLGAEYEKKKHRLQHELRMDYRRYMAQLQPDLRKNGNSHFVTGLIIGAADTNEALQRKKERYRQELQEQIAEQHRNRKREKDLELKVAATGANDPEKLPDRIRQLGLSRRESPVVTEPSTTAESGSSSRTAASAEGAARGRDMPPPGLPHVAFQSPLLEYSSALGLGEGHLSPSSQHSSLSTNAVETHRNNPFLPQPPSSLRETYRTPYGEPHQYYGNKNLLDPNMDYYGHFPSPNAGIPTSYWNVPPGGAVPSQLGNHSPHSQHSGYSFPEPPLKCRSESAVADSHIGDFPSERSRCSRERILSYRDALKQQIQEQQERRRLEREERERLEAQLEADMQNHEPWGRGGGGAPLRDTMGNLIADLKQMHRLNEEAYSNPELWQRRATAAMTTRLAEQPQPAARVTQTNSFNSADRLPGFTHVQTSQFARGKVFASQPSEFHLQEQDKYKAYLKQQMHREPSPPIPTLQRKHGRRLQHASRPATVHSYTSTSPLSEQLSSGLQSPPVPARRNQLRAAGDHRDLFNELSALRRQLRSEQKRLESDLQRGNWEEPDSPVNIRDRECPAVDVFDMARLRLQAPVRRPNSRNTEPRNLLRIHDSLQLKYTDRESRTGSGEDKLEEVGVVRRRRRDYRDSYDHQSSHRSTVQDDYLDLSPPEQNDYLRSVSGASRRGFLLESESAFIDPLGGASPVPPTPEQDRIRQLSARERRRLAKLAQRPQEGAASVQRSYPDPSGGRLNLQEAGSEVRSRNRTEPLDGSDDESSPVQSSPLSLNRESSEETVTTDSWIGPGTSNALKNLDLSFRRKRQAT
ncbi:centrosome and spindle pole associated protein 1-like isoform X2 [Poeciliopsis prolifica]|uniref:centrosome and spindle pole associated protein 1-like isoform X2 n=1 Tax=Poeciliopsis prolifica TaxID=188132 RepID=UPI00241339AD|nr:centrosome and spindle pole associated protein 1-like isoform X2 [Poeciliopsis prolifica]